MAECGKGMATQSESAMRELLQRFKDGMKNGVTDYNIPPLDPLVLPIDKNAQHQQIHIKEGLEMRVNYLEVVGLSNFDISEVSTHPNKGTLVATLIVSHISVSGEYTIVSDNDGSDSSANVSSCEIQMHDISITVPMETKVHINVSIGGYSITQPERSDDTNSLVDLCREAIEFYVHVQLWKVMRGLQKFLRGMSNHDETDAETTDAEEPSQSSEDDIDDVIGEYILVKFTQPPATQTADTHSQPKQYRSSNCGNLNQVFDLIAPKLGALFSRDGYEPYHVKEEINVSFPYIGFPASFKLSPPKISGLSNLCRVGPATLDGLTLTTSLGVSDHLSGRAFGRVSYVNGTLFTKKFEYSFSITGMKIDTVMMIEKNGQGDVVVMVTSFELAKDPNINVTIPTDLGYFAGKEPSIVSAIRDYLRTVLFKSEILTDLRDMLQRELKHILRPIKTSVDLS